MLVISIVLLIWSYNINSYNIPKMTRSNVAYNRMILRQIYSFRVDEVKYWKNCNNEIGIANKSGDYSYNKAEKICKQSLNYLNTHKFNIKIPNYWDTITQVKINYMLKKEHELTIKVIALNIKEISLFNKGKSLSKLINLSENVYKKLKNIHNVINKKLDNIRE